MGQGWSSNEILVLPQALQDFAWSAPMRDLAVKVGLSDVGLRKLLVGHGAVVPPQGHWNRLHAGKPVPSTPRVPPRRPGEIGRVRLDSRFADLLAPAAPLPSSGPFATADVPEDLEELYARELKAIGRATVPKTLERAHSSLVQILSQEQRRKDKFAESGWSWDAPKFDNAVDKRRLKILNAIFLALARRGHRADAYERDGEIHARATIGNTSLGLGIDLVARHRSAGSRGTARREPDMPASSALALWIDRDFDRQAMQSWQDAAQGRLETTIAEIAARIIVAGEARFRRSLAENEERDEQFRRREEQRRQEEIERRNRERLERLRASGELLRQAGDLRALIGRVRDAVSAGSIDVDEATLRAWEEWASAEADRLDPILSGQIMTHLA